MYRKIASSSTLLALILGFSCQSETNYDLQLRFQNRSDHAAVTKVFVWALAKEVTCLELISGSMNPRQLASYSMLEIDFPPDSTEKLTSIPAKQIMFFAEARNNSGSAFLRSCHEVDVTGNSVEILLEMKRFCEPTSTQDIPHNQKDDDCDGLTDECEPTDTDTDSDGVPDCSDECPHDPGKTMKGICGCGKPDVDDDNNGITDCVDECAGAEDSDADGVCDPLDQCLGNDNTGDFDGDGECNDLDTDDDADGWSDADEIACAADPWLVNSVPVDSDSDGVCDSQDKCDGDDLSGDANADGECNDLDTDDDGDGWPDADEIACDTDPLLADSVPIDTDGDGLCDMLEANPDNTMISASPDSVAADGSSTSTIVVQAVDSWGENLIIGGDTVTLSATGNAIISTVTDNGDGSYTATIAATLTDTLTISGTINAAPITDTAEVNFTSGPYLINDVASSANIELPNDPTVNSVAADFDGDGHTDIYIVNYSHSIPNRILWNNGDATFTTDSITGDMSLSRHAAAGDVNGDGRLDIVVANNGTNQLWLNLGGRSFTEGATLPSGSLDSKRVLLADLFGFGRLDIYFVSGGDESSHGTSAAQNELLRNDESGSFTLCNIPGDNSYTRSAALLDLENDGDLDIFEFNKPNNHYNMFGHLWVNNGAGEFTLNGNFIRSTDFNIHPLVAIDINGDNLTDIVQINVGRGARVQLNYGDNTFTTVDVQSFMNPGPGKAIQFLFSDVDNDGDVDAYATGSELFINTGTQENGLPIMKKVFYRQVTSYSGASIGDFNSDGLIDLFQPTDGNLNNLWLLSFSEPGALSSADSTIGVSSGELAADGVSSATITVYAKDGLGNDLLSGGDTVELSQDGSAIISAVIDHGDGTYTATVTNNVVETITVHGTIAGSSVSNSVMVTFTAP